MHHTFLCRSSGTPAWLWSLSTWHYLDGKEAGVIFAQHVNSVLVNVIVGLSLV